MYNMNALFFSLLCALAATALCEISSKIVGGSNADLGEFPWQGSLQRQGSGNSYSHICGCVLVANNRAVTAAHCLSSGNTYRVVFGMRRLNTNDGTEQYSAVSRFVNHPNYNGNSAGYPNDVAILYLSTSLDTSRDNATRTVPMASGSYTFAGDRCTITGWGRLSGGGSIPNNLQKVEMTILTNSDCSSRWSSISGASINSGHICIYEQGKSACSGDSGGPMVCNGVLAGVTSWGISTCSGSYPSVYTRISYFNSWINSNM